MSAKILVVDDEPSLLRLTGFALQTAGYQVVTAETAREALEKVRSEKPDLVILDVMLPDMSGLEVCQLLRADPKSDNLPIIMLSARAEVPDRVRGLKSGADEYITKPVDSDELLARIETLLQRVVRSQRAHQEVKRGKTIGFVGAKGGVGTTTVAHQVAVSLAGSNKPVIAVELKPNANTLCLQLGLNEDQTASDWLELAPEQISEEALSRRLVTHTSGLRVVHGSRERKEDREITAEQTEALVQCLSGMSDYTVIDVSCHPSPASRVALRSSSAVVLVVEPDPVCLECGREAIELFKAWGIPAESLGAVVVNRGGVVLPTLFSTVLPEIRSRLGCEILGVVPPSLDLCLKALHVPSSPEAPQRNASFVASLSELAERLSSGEPQ